MLPEIIAESVIEWFNKQGITCRITNIEPVGGGSINESFRFKTTHGHFFLKYNRADRYPGMFESEIQGLTLLKNTNTVYIPDPLTAGTAGNFSFLLMKYEEPGKPKAEFWDLFANQLSLLHRTTNDYFGLDHDNYIGSLNQSNKRTSNFYHFLIIERFEPLVKQAFNQAYFSREDIKHFESLYNKVTELIPEEKPALIHGDLWSGNVIISEQGKPCLIDPAVYYGNREADIAMTKLFGGFPVKFYDAYNDNFPLIKGWELRIEIHQLYPLLVHVNLFGQSYALQVRSIIRKY